MGLLRHRREDIRAGRLRRCLARLLDVEGRHRRLEKGEVHRHGNGATSLSLVAGSAHTRLHVVNAPRFLEHADVRLGEVGLRRRTGRRRYGSRNRQCVRVKHGWRGLVKVAVHEGLEGNKLGKLTAENLGASTKAVDEASRSLEVFGEIVHLVETLSVGARVHEEVRRAVKLDHNTTRFSGVSLVVLEVDALDVGKWVLDLVPGLFVVDVVGHRTLIGRVEDDEIHHILTDTRPGANAQSTTGEMLNDWAGSVSTIQRVEAGVLHSNVGRARYNPHKELKEREVELDVTYELCLGRSGHRQGASHFHRGRVQCGLKSFRQDPFRIPWPAWQDTGAWTRGSNPDPHRSQDASSP